MPCHSVAEASPKSTPVRLSETERSAVAGGAFDVQPVVLPLDDPEPPLEPLEPPEPPDPPVFPELEPPEPAPDEPAPPELLPKPPDPLVEHALLHAAHAFPEFALVAAEQLDSAARAMHVCELALLALKSPAGQLHSR
jgi:hypothetical protein